MKCDLVDIYPDNDDIYHSYERNGVTIYENNYNFKQENWSITENGRQVSGKKAMNFIFYLSLFYLKIIILLLHDLTQISI